MNPVVIIPTFVSARGRVESGPVTTTYDHTTSMSASGELPRCLESLRCVRGLGHIIVLVIAEPAIENKAASKIRAVAEQFPDLNIAVVGAPEMALVRQRMEQLNIGLRNEVGLAGYGAMRNLGLLLAGALDFDSVVFVDDDVVIGKALVHAQLAQFARGFVCPVDRLLNVSGGLKQEPRRRMRHRAADDQVDHLALVCIENDATLVGMLEDRRIFLARRRSPVELRRDDVLGGVARWFEQSRVDGVADVGGHHFVVFGAVA